MACRLARDEASRAHFRGHIRNAMRSRPKFYDARGYAAQVAGILAAIWKERYAANFAPLSRVNGH
jgi:predicted O-linked N-acetylglucosamine transferase (SPINDLY family)